MKAKEPQYIIVSAHTLDELCRLVNEKATVGYKPSGSLFYDSCQRSTDKTADGELWRQPMFSE